MNPLPAHYADANQIQRHDAYKTLSKYSKFMNFRNDGKDTLLDVGCGPGDVTIEIVLPVLPKNYRKLVGIDISAEMVKYANQQYASDKICFEKFDIGGEINELLKHYPMGFDHITSFYCLHWVPNQEKMLQNIYNLLKTDGECLLVFLISEDIITIYKELAKFNKWKKLMSNIQKYFAPYLFEENPVNSIEKLLERTRFEDIKLDIVESNYKYSGLKQIKESTTVINPIWNEIPHDKHEDYFSDYLNIAKKMGVFREADTIDACEFVGSHKVATIYAVK